jgi:hypothetical protein
VSRRADRRRNEPGDDADGEHENGALIWTPRLALLVSGAGAAVMAMSLLTMRVHAPSRPVAGVVAIVGGVAILVAALGWISSTIELRYAGVPLAQPPGPDEPPSAAGRRRGTLRRRSGIAYGVMALGSVWVLPLLFSGDGADLMVSAIAVAALGAGVLSGPVCRFVVTRQHLHVDLTFHRISVPRRLIGTFESSGPEIRLRLTDRDFYDLRVDSPLWGLGNGDRWRLNARARVRTAARLAGLLREVPAAPPTGDAVEIRYRTGTMVFAAVAAVVTAAVFVIGLSSW